MYVGDIRDMGDLAWVAGPDFSMDLNLDHSNNDSMLFGEVLLLLCGFCLFCFGVLRQGLLM